MNWTTACENTSLALHLLIENSYFAQREARKGLHSGFLSERAWANEYCTIKLCSSRRCGHSAAIAKIATEYFNHAIFLSPNSTSAVRLKEYVTKELTGGDEPRIISKITTSEICGERIDDPIHSYDMSYLFSGYNNGNPRKDFTNKFRGLTTEAVFVDCSSFLSKSAEEAIYTALGPTMFYNDYRFFIFVE